MMNRSRFRRRTALILPLASLLAAFSCEQPMTPEEEYTYAQQTVDWWIAANPDGLSAELPTAPLTRPEWSKPCSQNPPMNTVVLRYFITGAEIDLHFRCPLSASSTRQEVAAAFQFAVLTNLPHGISAPGWRFDLLTPTSSISEGVTVTAGLAAFRVEIDTQLYAIHGHSGRRACEPPQDAPAIEGCYLVREYAKPLHIGFTGSFHPLELQ